MRAALLLMVAAAACATTAPAQRSGRMDRVDAFTRGDLVQLFVHWREGERRRDAAMAQQALKFERSADRDHHEAELAYLRDVPSGPVCSAGELHLVGHPDPLGPGDYLFLEPVAGRYRPAFVTIVGVRGRPRILYRRPFVSEEELRTLGAAEVTRVAVERHVAHWQALEGRKLEEEAERTRRRLRYQVAAQRYAKANDVALVPFAPDPATVLRDLDGLAAEQVCARIVLTLRGG